MGKDLKGRELGSGYRQRPDGRYEGRWTDGDGKKHSVYGKTIRETRAKIKDAIQNADKVIPKDKQCTVDEWFEVWIATYKAFVKDSTSYRYRRMYLKHISPKVGGHFLSDVTRVELQATITDMQEIGLSASSQAFAKKILTGMFSKAFEDEMIVRNPASGIVTAKRLQPDTVVLTKQQERDFLQGIENEFYAPVLGFQFNTGLRAGELFGLRLEDVDIEEGFVYVRRTLETVGGQPVEHDPKTQQSRRRIPINSECRRYLDKWLDYRKYCADKHKGTECRYFFCNQHFRPLNLCTYNDLIMRMVARVNLTLPAEKQIPVFRSHAMRRSFATRCFEARIPPKIVQKYLGHTNIKTTLDVYTRVFDDVDPLEIEKIVFPVVQSGQKVVNSIDKRRVYAV